MLTYFDSGYCQMTAQIIALNQSGRRVAPSPFLRRMSASRIIDHYLEGSVIAYHGEQLEEVIVAEQGDLTEEERALLDLLNKRLRRELRKAA